jgi:protein phosphatase
VQNLGLFAAICGIVDALPPHGRDSVEASFGATASQDLLLGLAMTDGKTNRLTIDYGRCTHDGGKRENQDCLDAFLDGNREACCFVIADGLGTYRRGRRAAQLAVESILRSFADVDAANPDTWLYDAFQAAHDLIKKESGVDPSQGKMKTTCAVAVLLRGKAHWASVGDSRIYVLRGGKILHRTKDHSVVQVLLDMGEIEPSEVRSHPDRNRVIRVLGMEEDMKPSVCTDGLQLQPGDGLLLCTDGLWSCVDDDSLVDYIAVRGHMDAQAVLDSLFHDITSGAGGKYDPYSDNLSAQLVLIRQ